LHGVQVVARSSRVTPTQANKGLPEMEAFLILG
jgi:hypothetical protein